jgi:hypothetical protein
VTQPDIDTVTRYIDDPIYWPSDPALAPVPVPPVAGLLDAGVAETLPTDAGADGG